MRSLGIVPCGHKKVWDVNPTAGATAAHDVYVGTFAVLCRRYAEKFYPASWCILSAKYGFLFPNDLVLGPYNVTFRDRRTGPLSVERLLAQVQAKGLDQYDEIVVVAGRTYVARVKDVFGEAKIRAPLSGCRRIGYMMQKLSVAMTTGRAL